MSEETPVAFPEVSILSVDAWRNGPGWDWNNWHKVGTVRVSWLAGKKPRQILKYMRDEGYLAEKSKGKCGVDDDQYNIVICDKNTRQPLYAIAYGEAL